MNWFYASWITESNEKGTRKRRELTREQTIVFLSQGNNAFDGGISLKNRDGFLCGGDDGEWLRGIGGGKG